MCRIIATRGQSALLNFAVNMSDRILLQNRVDPFGRLHANASRGLLMGNRGGCFHRDDQSLRPQHWVSQRWICCVTEFRGRHRKVMSPGRYTEVFFLDEATALAAGHRPCFECRRQRAVHFVDCLMSSGRYDQRPRADDLDALIARQVIARLAFEDVPRPVSVSELPDGAIFNAGGRVFLKIGGCAHAWSFEGYGGAEPLPERGNQLTCEAVCDALRGGYQPVFHPSLIPKA